MHESIKRGDAVVVHGRVRVDVWEREGQPNSVTWVVDATFVGHDLTRGTSSFVKTARASRATRARPRRCARWCTPTSPTARSSTRRAIRSPAAGASRIHGRLTRFGRAGVRPLGWPDHG